MGTLFTIDCGDIQLRELMVEDADAIFEITSQPEVYKFLPDWKTTREKRLFYITNYEIPSNKAFLSSAPNIEGQNFLKLGMIHKETNQLIGFIGTGIKEELPEPNREIVYGISTKYRNRGYTTKAVRGLIDYLFEKTNLELLNAIALPTNIGSNKVIQKSGFHYVGDIEVDHKLHHHYTLHKSAWEKSLINQ